LSSSSLSNEAEERQKTTVWIYTIHNLWQIWKELHDLSQPVRLVKL
jgi:hypothetical protein